MRLYLSSSRRGRRFDRLLDLAGPDARVAVISNAVDYIPGVARGLYLQHVLNPIDRFRKHGLAACSLDLRDYFGRRAELETALSATDLVWVTGGNSFLLRRAMRQSGFDALLQRRLAEDSLVYGGWSAGAAIAGASLRGLDLMDAPKRLAAGYEPTPIWEGLGLRPYAIVPHFESRRLESVAAARCAAALAKQGVPHRTLCDGQAILVDGDREELV